jgi:NAD-dependent deacetylase
LRKKIAVLTGAGISAESGIKTFRVADGLWENYRIEDVATPEAFHHNPELVLEFYNQRRRQLLTCQPNPAHLALAELEQQYEVTIITQNVDDLHERGGSTHIIHLHGELLKMRSTVNPLLIYPCIRDMKLGNKCAEGSQLRPHIVWFGEAVPEIERAIPVVRNCDILIVIGTSLLVYPVAGLINYVRYDAVKWLIDPGQMQLPRIPNLTFYNENATTGVTRLVKELLDLP